MKIVKPTFIGLCLTTLSVFSFATDKIESYKAAYYIGKSVEVCGNVSQIKNVKKQTYINLDGSYPHQKLTILVWNDDLNQIVNKIGRLDRLEKSRICVKGVVDDYKGNPQIILKTPDNIQVQF
ncbi:hypothetical protein ACWIVU_05650 [Ursidibacter arcticus]